ncbi:MAG: hypothetical protein DMG13_15660 [Acidobacteria bacterium]|nr:MAG: hypothetical protein DMG13_15660 [Acidobacteriota bacterium]
MTQPPLLAVMQGGGITLDSNLRDATVGALYERPFFLRITEIRAVIDRPYSKQVNLFTAS